MRGDDESGPYGEDLLDGMVDTAIAGYDPLEPDADWKHAVRSRILSARGTLLAHPWARQVIESRTRRTPTVLAYMDTLAGGRSRDDEAATDRSCRGRGPRDGP